MISCFVLSKRGAYNFRNLLNFSFQLREVVISFVIAVALLTLIAYATKVAEFYSRSWALIWIAITIGQFGLYTCDRLPPIEKMGAPRAFDPRRGDRGRRPGGPTPRRQIAYDRHERNYHRWNF